MGHLRTVLKHVGGVTVLIPHSSQPLPNNFPVYRKTLYGNTKNLLKVARYSFSGPIPPKFEHKLRRHKQSFGKIATTVVLDKDENMLLSGLQRHRSCHSNEMTLLPI